MNVSDAIAQRRSIKKFQDTPVTREEIEALLNAAVLAPNHHLTSCLSRDLSVSCETYLLFRKQRAKQQVFLILIISLGGM